MPKKTCESCEFFIEFTTQSKCYRYPPIPVFNMSFMRIFREYPPVEPFTRACGEYRDKKTEES